MRNLPEWPVAFCGGVAHGRDRHPAERLVDRPGARVRPGRFRRQGRDRRRRAAATAWPDTWRTAPTSSTSTSAACRRAVRHPQVARLEDVIGRVERLGKPSRPADAGRRARARRRRHDPLHLGHDRQAQGRARHPPQHRPRTSWRPAFGAARNFLRRGEPLPQPDPTAPQRAILLGGAVVPRHRLLARCWARRCSTAASSC